MAQATANPDFSKAANDTFDDFLQAAIRDYAGRGWQRPNFVALLIASGQTGAMAKGAIGSTNGLKTLALGTLGVVAAKAILVRVISGPLGILLTGVSIASLVAFFIKNQREIIGKTSRFRELIARTKVSFEEAQTGYRQNRMDARERDLMIDGLMKRFLRECDEI